MDATKIIPSSNGRYSVTNDGVVTSHSRKNFKDYALTQRTNNNGYCYVDVRIAGKKKKLFIHRAVAQTYIPNPENKPCVNHKDGNKKNNSVENLEWCTHSENMKHAVSMGLNVTPNLSGENHPMRKLTEEKVRRIRELYDNGSFVSDIAQEFKITNEQVYNIVNRKHWRNVI